MDEVNEMDGETSIIGKSRVTSSSYLNELNISSTNVLDQILIEEILIGRTGDDENFVKYKDEVAVENAILDAQFLFPQS